MQATNAITLSKAVAPSHVASGGTVTYTLTLTNSGTGIAQVALTDTLATGFTPLVYTTTITVPGHGWDTESNAEMVVFAATAPVTEGVYANPVVTATYASEVLTLVNTAPITVTQPRVAVGKTAAPDPVQADAELIYTIRVTNTGDVPLTAVEVADALPAQTSTGDPTAWSVGVLNPGEVWEQTLPVTVGWGYSGTLTNTVAVSTAEGATDVYSMATLAQVTPAIEIQKHADPPVVEAGDPLTYTITVTNTGNVSLIPTVTDTLPGAVTPNDPLTWTFALTETSRVWQETVVVTAAWGYSGTLENHVEVMAPEGAQAQDAVTSNVIAEPDLAVAKQVALDDVVRAGEMVTYTLTVTNTGSAPLDATITDTLPTPVSPTGVLTWTALLDEPNAVWTTWFTATVDAEYAGPLVNEMEVSTAEGVGDTASVTVDAEISITSLDAVNDSPTLLGETTTLTAAVATGSNVVYAWDFGDGTGAVGAVVTHTYPAVGSYTAVVTATNAVDVVTATTVVTVTDVPIAGLVAENDSPTPLDETTALTASVEAGSNVVYAWDFGDGTGAAGAVVTHTYPAVGTYTAVVTAANDVNAVTATTVVTVTDVPITGAQLVNDSPTLLGETTTLTASVDTGSNVSYTLAFGDGTPPVTGTLVAGAAWPLTHTYAAEGVYTATLTVSNAESLAVVTSVVTVVDVEPITRLAAHNDGPTTLGRATTLSTTVETGTGITYAWEFGDGEEGAGAVTTHVYPAEGVYTATVTATNARGEATASTVVSITAPSYVIYLPLVLRSYTSNAPDLVVTDLTVTPEGGEYRVSVTVQNRGPQPVVYGNNFYVDLYIDREPAALLPGDVSWGAQGDWFGVNESHTFTELVTLGAGTHALYVQADTDNTVIEANEGNNRYGPVTVEVTGVQQLEERESPTALPGPRPTPTARP